MRARLIGYVIVLAIADVIVPVPIIALVVLYVVWRRPGWFADLYREIYGSDA